MTRLLFVGGPWHGLIKSVKPQGGMGAYIVRSIPTFSQFSTSEEGALDTSINEFVYYAKRIQMFNEFVDLMVLNGREDNRRVLDAVLKPEVRDLYYPA